MAFRFLRLSFFAGVLMCAFAAADVRAQSFEQILSGQASRTFEILGQGYEDPMDDGFLDSDKNKEKTYIYEDVTMSSLAKLYWAIDFLNIENPAYIDNYMKINECGMYQTYSAMEFEWNEIRAATKVFILKNKKDFPLRFRFVQPLKLLEYDNKRSAFLIDPEFQYKAARRFEVFAKDSGAVFCSNSIRAEYYEGFNPGLMLELSRPFSLEYLPLDSKKAEQYIDTVTENFRKLNTRNQTREMFSLMRQAYIVFKFKVFAHGENVSSSQNGLEITQMLGALESFEIYADPQLKNLMYSKSYIVKTDASKQNARLVKEYDILRDRSKNGGVLTNIN